MAILSNAQSLLFVAIWTEEVKLSGPPVTTLKGWFGNQQMGQTKAMITDAVVSHRGVVTHTVGDAMLCSFADPKAALQAAASIQNQIAKAAGSASGMIVKARIGLAHGPVRVIAGKVSGDAVNAAGMLMEKCPPGEILLDQALLEAGGSAAGIACESCGSIEGIAAHRVPASVKMPETTGPVTAVAPEPTPRPAPAPRPARQSAPEATMIVKFGGVEQRFRPADGEVQFGRSDDNQVVVPRPYVSRRHAKIVWREGAVPYLVNLSQNGTCVRLKESGKEIVCEGDMRLEGSGFIVLCNSFGMVTSSDDIVTYTLVSK
jgi:hypothetical protein